MDALTEYKKLNPRALEVRNGVRILRPAFKTPKPEGPKKEDDPKKEMETS